MRTSNSFTGSVQVAVGSHDHLGQNHRPVGAILLGAELVDDLEARGRPFSVTSAGKFALLHTFAAGTNKKYRNGNLPGSLVQGPDGKIYGDTLFGGIGGCNGCCGNGVLYRVNKRNCMVSDCKQLPFDVAPGRAGSFFSAA